MNGEKKIVLFALSTCGACRKTKLLLDKNGIEYLCVELDTVNRESRDKLLEKVKQYNPRETFPTIVIDGGKKVVIGYAEEEILSALKACGLL
jgi:glutaredoxin-like protein NrdH